MQVQKVNSQNFNGKISQKAVGFLLDNGRHLFVQGSSFFLADKFIQPIDSFESFMRTKVLIDFGEYISNIVVENSNTTARQCTNIFSALSDCTKDVIRWGKALADKINKR